MEGGTASMIKFGELSAIKMAHREVKKALIRVREGQDKEV